MSENAEKMRERHEKEIESLQKECNHTKISEWQEYHWSPGHILGKCKVCKFCHKIVEKTWQEPGDTITKEDQIRQEKCH